MTTYNGRSANYDPGKEVPNKEPPMSKYVVEKLYKVHRERVLKVQPVVDCHVFIPSFLKNQTWKKNAEKVRQDVIRKENQDIYRRIERMETQEGYFTRESREHIARVESKLRYLKKLKDHGRVVDILKRQKENENFLQRIERAVPQYSIKKCEEWYQHHVHFKEGRRSDPTSGHIMRGMKGLLPSSLPPLTTRPSDLVSIGLELESQKSMSAKSHRLSSLNPSLREGKIGDSASSVMSVNSSTIITSESAGNHPRFVFEEKNRIEVPPSSHNSKPATRRLSDQFRRESLLKSSSHNSYSSSGGFPHDSSHLGVSTLQSSHTDDNSRDSTMSKLNKYRNASETSASDGYMSSGSESSVSKFSNKNFDPFDDEASDTDDQGGSDSQDSLLHLINTSNLALMGNDDLVLITQAPVSHETNKKCVIQVYTAKDYNENLHLKVISGGLTPQVLAQRVISIDSAYDITNQPLKEGQLSISEEDDLKSISEALFALFKEADVDKSGFLTFSEFQQLMIKVDLGISVQEMRFIISEADTNETGTVDYTEFVPLAVDLVQSFRARNKAKNISSQEEFLLDEQILKTISSKDLQRISEACLQKIHEVDVKRYGLIRTAELKKCLNAVAAQLGLRESEIIAICQIIPKDQFGRCKYNAPNCSFFDTMSKARFLTLKNAALEARSSGLQKYLLEQCRKEEEKNIEVGAPLTGMLPSRVLVNLLSNSPKLSLTRMQILVIVSEASINEGIIDYNQVVPVIAKAIEIMMEPKSLRQRAELIEHTDLSAEALLKGMSTADFSKNIQTLFRSYDLDHNVKLSQEEFIACLQSLELQLSRVEMLALFDAADLKHTGNLSYEEFADFFVHNLLNLEREKHLRMLHQSILQLNVAESDGNPHKHVHGNGHHKHDSSKGSSPMNIAEHAQLESHKQKKEDESHMMMLKELKTIFQLADLQGTGFVPYEEFETILHELSFKIDSRLMVDLMRSEVHTNEHGLVDYNASLTSFAEVLMMLKASESAKEAYESKLKIAESKAVELALAMKEDIDHIVNYLRDKLKAAAILADAHGQTKYSDIYAIFNDSHSGLSHNESVLLMSKLLNTNSTDLDISKQQSSDSKSKIFSEIDPRLLSVREESNSIASMSLSMDSQSSEHVVAVHEDISHNSSFRSSKKDLRHNSFPVTKYKLDFTKEELFSAIVEVRKLSILRALITDDSENTSTIGNRIRDILKAEQDRLIADKQLEEGSELIPVKVCFTALEKTRDLRLTRSQIMLIISWADCFDKDHSFLFLEKFCSHAAAIIAQMNILHEVRAEVLSTANISDKKALHGWRIADLETYLETELSRVADEHGEVASHTTLWETIKSIPRLRLTDIETTTICAAFSTHNVNWKSIVQPALNSIRSLCRERLIQRRVHLLASADDRKKRRKLTSRGSESFALHSKNAIKTLADKLIGLVKLPVRGDNMIIQFPLDREDMNVSASQASAGPAVFRSPSHAMDLHLDEDLGTEETENGEKLHLLFRGTKVLPMTRIHFVPAKIALPPGSRGAARKAMFQAVAAAVVANPSGAGVGGSSGSNSTPSSAGAPLAVGLNSSSSSSSSAGAANGVALEKLEVKSTVNVFLKIFAIEDTKMYSGMSLIAEVTSADSKISATTSLPVKLPSLGLMDKESAESFILNLVDNIFIESENGLITIKVKE